MFRLNRNKQKTYPNSLKESIFGLFLENVGLFPFVSVCCETVLFVSKQFCLFRLFRYRFETPKQTERFSFWFHETNRNKRETDLVSVCFGSNRNLFWFVSRTPYGHVPLSYSFPSCTSLPFPFFWHSFYPLFVVFFFIPVIQFLIQWPFFTPNNPSLASSSPGIKRNEKVGIIPETYHMDTE